MRVVPYARVSTVKQAERDLSIPDQLKQLRQYCEMNQHEIVREYREEGASATDDNRPEFQAMMDDILYGGLEVDAILVLTTSRFFRDAFGAEKWKRTLKKVGVRVIAITQDVTEPDTPSGELVEGIFALIDQHESRMIGFHTARGMKENADRGNYNGSRAPYGYAIHRAPDEKGNLKSHLVPNPDEASVVQRIFDLYVNEGLGNIEIAKRLNADQVPYRKAKKWYGKQVLRILENETYQGEYIYNRYDKRNDRDRPESEWVRIAVTELVTKELFEAADAIRKSKVPTKKNGRTHTGELLLSGLMKCGLCGETMVSSTAKSGKYAYYTCKTNKNSGKDACAGFRLPVAAIEKAVMDEVIDKAFSKINVLNLVKAIRRSIAESQRPVRAIRKELDEVEKKLQRYYDAFESGAMDPELVGDRVKNLTADQRTLKAEFAKRTKVHELPASLTSDENIAKVQSSLRQMVLTSPPGAIRQYLNIILEKIIVHGHNIEIVGKTAGVMGILAMQNEEDEQGVHKVRIYRNEWQPVCRANANFLIRANIRRKMLEYKGFPENPIRMAQWLQAMLDTGQVPSKTALCHLAGVSRARVIQYLNLLTLPPDYVFPLRYFDGLQEAQLRPLVGVGVDRQRQGLNKVINRMGGAVLHFQQAA